MKIIQLLNQNNVKVNYKARIIFYSFIWHVITGEGGTELTLTFE